MTDTNKDIINLKRAIKNQLELLELMRAAEDYQWVAPLITGPSESLVSGGSDLHSDPTGDTATNETRLKLRAKMNRTGVDVTNLLSVSAMMRDRVETALLPWTG